MNSSNPFTPGFGQVPYRLAGREQIIEEIVSAFDQDNRDPSLTSIFVGARGTGKTALLTYLGKQAQQRDWVSVDVVARNGMLNDIFLRSIDAASEILEPSSKRKLTSLNIANIGSLEWENNVSPEQNWRGKMNELLTALNDKGIGLLITVDEVDPTVPEVAELISTYQLFIREERKVALLLAGLPGKMLSLLDKKDITFMRRARKYNLGSIPKREVMEAFADTVKTGQRYINAEALAEATKAIGGFAFMLQEVGYRAWKAGDGKEITLEDIYSGVELAKAELEGSVLESTYLELNNGDKAFLAAMLKDGGESAISEIIQRTGKSNNSVQKTRRRLMDLGIIGERGWGSVDFELPYFKEYLKERLDPELPN